MNNEFVTFRKKLIALSRTTIYAALLSCLLFPVLVISAYAASAQIKGIVTIACLASVLGVGTGWLLLSVWEKKMQQSVTQLLRAKMEQIHDQKPVPGVDIASYKTEIQRLNAELHNMQIGYEHQINLMQSSVAKSKEDMQHLHLEMDNKLEEMRLAYLEFEDLRKEYRRQEEELSLVKEESQKDAKHKESLLNEYQRTIAEQRIILEKKQRYITKLEGKVRDLMYEIRSLLQLEALPDEQKKEKGGLDINEQEMIDSHLSSSLVSNTLYDFSVQLQKYIEKAENLTGVNHLGYVGGSSPRFLDLALDSYAVDRRRLFDSFRDETAGAVFIYSPYEKKILFVNPAVKSLLGWSPEKFMKDFFRLIVQGATEWEKSLAKLKSAQELSFALSILNKGGEAKLFECYLGMILKGPFSQHVLGMLILQ